MKYLTLILAAAMLLVPGQLPAQSPVPSAPQLQRTLEAMERSALAFRNTQADFVWEQFQKVVNETDVQKGTIFFRRSGKEVQMAANIREPDRKHVLFTDGKVRLYQPRIDQVTEYGAGNNRQEFESFLVLGFGASGRDLQKSFEVTYAGSEAVQGKTTSKLLLVPRSERVRGMFERIFLWIDPDSGISVQQQFMEPSGDFRLSRYDNVKVNGSLPRDAFTLPTTSRTKVVRP